MARMCAAIQQAFSYRRTHAAPARLPDPLGAWERPCAEMAKLNQRLRTVASAGADITRRRQLLVFDRYLARLARVP